MTFAVTKSLLDFDFWAGAKYTVSQMTVDQILQIEDILDIDNSGGYYTETEINDLFWFDADLIANWLGFEDFEDLEEHNKKGE